MKAVVVMTLFLAVALPKAEAQTLFWNQKVTTGQGGTGNWNTSSSFWSTANNTATVGTWTNGDAAVFGGTTGTVTLTTGISATGMTFTTTTYVLSGTSTLTLTGTPTITIGTGSANFTEEFDNPFSVANQIQFAAGTTGKLTLNFGPVGGASASTSILTNGFKIPNTVASGSRINGNYANAFGTSGNAGPIVIDANGFTFSNISGATNTAGVGNTIYNNIQLNPSGAGSFSISLGGTKGAGTNAPSFPINYAGVISGSADVYLGNAPGAAAGGGGATIFSNNANTYSGKTIVNNGAQYFFQCGVDNCFPSTNQFIYGFSGTGYGLVDLNGHNITIGSLESNGTGFGITNTSAATTSTITINGGGTSNSNATFAAVIGANSAFTNYGYINTPAGGGTYTGNNNIALVLGASSGSLTLTGANTFTTGVTLSGGALIMGVANALASGLPVTLNGGTFSSGATTGFSQSVSTLNLTDNSSIVLGTGTHTVTFAASNGISWTSGKTITITGWTGTADGAHSGTAGRLFFGTTSLGLTSTQLAQIVFVISGNNYNATILSTGEVVPVCNTPVVSSTTNTSPACAGTTFSLSTSATGTAPLTYSWAGPNSFTSSSQNPSIINATTAATGTYTVTVTTGCGSSSTATTTATVNAAIAPSVSIAANPGNTICSGTNVTFTATPTNGGTSPTYVWTLNGSTVGDASNVYTNSSLGNGDVVACTLTSNAACVSPTTASSNTITIILTAGASQPGAFTAKTTFVYKGQTGVVYTVPNVAGVTYAWSYSGTGATINGSGNSVTVDYSSVATSGTLSVTATISCGTSTARTLAIVTNDHITVPTTNFDYSFVTLGCNRVDYLDTTFSTGDPDYACGKSTANVYQLKRVFTEISQLTPLPKYLVMTGDIVMGYKGVVDTAELVKQLRGWRAIYESHPLSSMGITLIAIPGNHETQNKAAGKTSYVEAEQIFVREMAPYIHGSNGPGVGGPDGLTTDQSKLTYSFNNGSDHFIIIDTDPVGKDNITPYKWIAADIQAARANHARHIFAFGHKPAYSSPYTPAGGLDAASTLAQRDSLWKYLEANNCEAMFSAHEHLWDTIHPHHGKTWQVINGNGGTRVEVPWVGTGKQYYGYTLVNLYTNKTVNVMGLGRNTSMSPTVGTSYTINEDASPTTVRNNFNICLTTTSTTSVTACNSYAWNATTYTASGTYTYTTTNSAGCDSVATLNLTMSPSVVPSVSITTASNTICAGAGVTFTATPTNGGASPTYVWAVNGGTVGTNSATYTTSSLTNNDVVSCTLTSNSSCASPTTASSNSITISILAAPNQPGNFTTRLNTFVYQGQAAVSYSVANVPGTTYNWSFSGTGATINGSGNNVTIDYSISATTGTLSVTANNTCGTSTPRSVLVAVNSPITIPATNLDYSFVTLGCNRVDYLDTTFSTGDPNFACGKSTANVYQLNRVFTEISHLNPLPKYLVMTGDIVMGYKGVVDTAELVKQLRGWRGIYESHPLSSMGITLIAIPGNHETQNKNAGKTSYIQAEQIFVREMAPYIHGSNGPGVGGPDGLTTDQSKLTYSFNNGSDHFIIIDTDPVGKDNITPYKWIAADIQAARANHARHIFAFGHKPAYSSPYTPAGGLDAASTLAQRDSLWKYLEANNCEAMFSAHEHLWDTIHPHHGKTWQVINGNGGTRVEVPWVGTGKQYYGYTLVNLYTDKTVNVMGLGRNTAMSPTVGTAYPINEDGNPTTVRNNFNICLTTSSTNSITACNSYVWNAATYTASGTYTFTTTNAAGCDSIATLNLTVNPNPVQPAAFTASTATVTAGTNGVVYTVPNDATVTYTWSYSGSGATINGTGNSITINFATSATSGTLSVTASNANCGTSAPTILAITVTPITNFTAGNLVVVQTAGSVSKGGSAITLKEYTTGGTTGAVVSIPATGSSPLQMAAGPGGSEGFLTRSAEGSFLVLGGYSTTVTGITDITATTASSAPRSIFKIDAHGAYTQVGSSTTNYNANDIRAAISDGTNYWAAGASVANADGIDYYGPGTPAALGTGAIPVKAYGLRIFNNQIYYSTQKAGPNNTVSHLGIFALGSGEPTSGSPVTTQIIDVGATALPTDFSFSTDGKTCYVAITNNTSGVGGIQKWTNTTAWATTGWTESYLLSTGVSTVGAYALTVDYSGANPVIYATTNESNTVGNRIIKITDDGSHSGLTGSSAATTLVTGAANTWFHGIDFAPACIAPAITSVSSNTICAGNALNLTSTTTGSQTLSYAWTGPNGFTSTVQNPSISNAASAATGTYSLTVTNSCGTASATTSATVNSSPTATVSASGATTFCSGGSVTLTAASGASSYSWSNGATTQAINLTSTGNYSVTATGSNGCTATSATTAVIVNSTVTPSVSISANTGNTVCSGTTVTFMAIPANGGTLPHYQWKLNGTNVGTDTTAYSNSSLSNNDQVTCVLTSNAICATASTASSNTVTITISGTVTPLVSISSGSGTTVCSGTTVLFTATPTNGGSSPAYQWKLNGTNTGTNSATYTNNSLNTSDNVTCVMTTSNNCATTNTATSNSLVMAVNPNVTPSVSVGVNTGTIICSGTSVTFTATATNGGTPSYQWTKNSVNVGTNNPVYGTNTLANHDTIVCTITSTAICRTSNTAASSKIIMKVNSIPASPATFTVATGAGTITRLLTSSDAVNRGQTGVVYTVANDTTVTSYTWHYTGNGATINGSGNSITIDYSSIATAGNLQITASNTCGTSLATVLPVTILDATQGNMRITEYMYSGTNGEYVEFTNISSTPVDMTGWSFDDNTRTPGSQNLTAFGIVQPGESVIMTETSADSFHLAWNLCPTIKVVGDNTNNIGRADELNLYNENTNLVDRLSYDDQALGGVRTQSKSAWVTAAGLGIDKPALWKASVVGDSVGSFASAGGDVGSPGKSTRATVAFNPCTVQTGGPRIVIDVLNTTNYLDAGLTTSPVSPYGISGVVSDVTDPGSTLGINFTISDSTVSVNSLTVTVTSSNTGVVPLANLHLTGSGASRNLKIIPANVGYSNITLKVDNGTKISSYVIIYGASANSATPNNTFWHTGMSDASDGIPLDDSSFVTGDDELNVLNVYSRYHSGLPLVSFNYTPFLNLPDLGKPEVDVEVAFKSNTHANRMFFAGSMSNSGDDFANTPNRDRVFATTVTGAGVNTSIAVVGYCVLRDKLVAWGDAQGYDFTSSATEGINPKLINGFDVEGMVMGPDSSTLYVGFRAPLVPMTNRTKAVIAPIANFETWFNNGTQTGDPTIGNPIELDLGGRGIRDIIRLSNGSYVITAGDPAADDSHSAIFKWTGNPADAPIQVPSDADGLLNMEGVMQVNQGGQLSLTKLEVINDGGSAILYTDLAEAKELSIHNHRKFSSNVLSNLTLGACSTYSATISANGSTTFNVGSGHSVTLTASSGTSYLWSNGATTQSITVSTVSGNYSVTVTNNSGCTATSAITTVTVHALVSDANLDGITNNTDFLLLVGKFNQLCTCTEDMNHDGVVNNTDFLILVGQFNQTAH